jgi:predicted site-specific integrase-resolvase
MQTQQKTPAPRSTGKQNETARQFGPANIGAAMDKPAATKLLRCAIYTRKSTEHNLDLEFNSLQAQREACEAYIKSQAHEGWCLVHRRFDDGAFSGASLERPALQELLTEVRTGRVDVFVVYKVDRLTRSLSDFAKLVELFDQHSVSFVSVTQSFNTTTSMGRLTLNVLLSFAQKLFPLARSVVAYGLASILAGRIFDDCGNRMTPTHTKQERCALSLLYLPCAPTAA